MKTLILQRLPFSADLHRSRFALRTPFQKQRGGIIECPRRRQPFAPAGLRAHEHIIARIGLFGKAEKTFTHSLRMKQRMKTALYPMQTTDIAKPLIALICRAGACLPPNETVDTQNGKRHKYRFFRFSLAGRNPKGFQRGKQQDGKWRSVTRAKRQGTRCNGARRQARALRIGVPCCRCFSGGCQAMRKKPVIHALTVNTHAGSPKSARTAVKTARVGQKDAIAELTNGAK